MPSSISMFINMMTLNFARGMTSMFFVREWCDGVEEEAALWRFMAIVLKLSVLALCFIGFDWWPLEFANTGHFEKSPEVAAIFHIDAHQFGDFERCAQHADAAAEFTGTGATHGGTACSTLSTLTFRVLWCTIRMLSLCDLRLISTLQAYLLRLVIMTQRLTPCFIEAILSQNEKFSTHMSNMISFNLHTTSSACYH